MRSRHRVRLIVNIANLSTPLGLLVAALGGARIGGGPDGLLLARGYRLPLPYAPAFTVGNVVVLKLSDDRLAARPRLLIHEARHATQYAVCLGPVMIVLYLIAAGASWLLCGDFASYNPFERTAGLDDGGYVRRSLWFRAPPAG